MTGIIATMGDLLFEQFPPTPRGTEGQAKKAIVMKCTWMYDDSANYIPLTIRNRIPDHLKRDGKLCVNKGAEGFLYDLSPNGEWGIAIFLHKSIIIHGRL